MRARALNSSSSLDTFLDMFSLFFVRLHEKEKSFSISKIHLTMVCPLIEWILISESWNL
ncbi:Uncharacterised protein [Vibrio cholerae]|uniref:Uncharacterized protein n=1 Tax=Vibrio cholerae TaxID=666 RepID=A0A655PA83_VIBCL|nr:Uncharacterised protein [Vibrio cholerae]